MGTRPNIKEKSVLAKRNYLQGRIQDFLGEGASHIEMTDVQS